MKEIPAQEIGRTYGKRRMRLLRSRNAVRQAGRPFKRVYAGITSLTLGVHGGSLAEANVNLSGAAPMPLVGTISAAVVAP